MGWTREDASHLLLRAGLGGSIHQVETLYAMGRWSAVDHVMDFDNGADPAWEIALPPGVDASASRQREETLTLLYRLLGSTRPLQARLTWFWLDHFTPAVRLAGRPALDAQARVLRAQAAGPYKAFLPALYRSGVIDGHLAGSIGRGAVSDQELLRQGVTRGAHSAGGGTLVVDRPAVRVAPADHADIVRRLFDRPDTMREVCEALHRAFVSPFADSAQVSRLTDAWQASGGRIAAVMRALLRSHGFWDLRVRGGLVKGPLEFAAGLIQRLDIPLDRALLNAVADSLARAGHWLVLEAGTERAPDTARPPEASALMQRYAFARHAVFNIDPARVASAMYAALPRRLAPQAFITLLSQRLGIPGLGAHTRALVTDHLGQHEVTGAQQERVLGALYLLVCSPEYQRC